MPSLVGRFFACSLQLVGAVCEALFHVGISVGSICHFVVDMRLARPVVHMAVVDMTESVITSYGREDANGKPTVAMRTLLQWEVLGGSLRR